MIFQPLKRIYWSKNAFGGIMKRTIGLIAFFIAIGMLIMLIAGNRLIGLIIISLLLFVGYNCFCGD